MDKLVYNYRDSGLVGFTLNGTEYFYIRNAQSDIIGILDSNGTEVVKYTYDTWGKLISIDGTLKDTVGVKNPYRYRGYRYDTEIGFYYLQSRYYNPEWGRFINSDSVGGMIGELLSHNVFAYCFNNPINHKDSNGFFPTGLYYGTELNTGFVWRVITPKQAARLEQGLSIQARNINGNISLQKHVTEGSTSIVKKQSQWISTSKSESVARRFDRGSGIVKVDLSKVPNQKFYVPKKFANVKAVQKYFHQQEVTIFKEIPFEAVVDYKGTNSGIKASIDSGSLGGIGSSGGLDKEIEY